MANPDDGGDPVQETRMSTLVFLDFEATGLLGPAQRPRITELCLLAVHREDLSSGTSFPRVVNKLTLCLNPKKPIQMVSSQITGLYNDNLERQKGFSEDTVTLINGFLSLLEQPVCLIAHYGNGYDFPLLKAELNRVNQSLRRNIYCADSIEVFRSLDLLDLVRNCSSNETILAESTGIPVQFMSDYTTPKKSRTAVSAVSLKRKSPEPAETNDLATKKEKANTATGDVKRTLVFEQTDKDKMKEFKEISNQILISEETRQKTDRDSKVDLKVRNTSGDTFKEDLLEEFEFSESIEDDELIAATDMAEKSMLNTNDLNNMKQDHCEMVNTLAPQTNEQANGQQNLCQSRNLGNDVISGSGYSVRVDSKTNSSDKFCSENTISETTLRPCATAGISGSNSPVASKLSSVIKSCHEKTFSSPFTMVANTDTSDSNDKDSTKNGAGISVYNKKNESNSPNSAVLSSGSLITTPGPATPLCVNKVGLSYSSRGSHQNSNIPSTSGNSSGSTPLPKKSYKLVEIYKRLYGHASPESHRAEDDCITLVKCSQRTKDFVSTIDKQAELFSNIKPGY